jgi:beta-ureidopropionase
MREFIAACPQFAITPNDVKANIDQAIHWVEKAANEFDADLVVLPETVTTGFVTGLDPNEL